MKKKRLKLKKPFAILFKLLLSLFIIAIIFLFIYLFQIRNLKKLGYSNLACKNIVFKLKKDYVLSIPFNKTLDAAFVSNDFNIDNLDYYSKIEYVNHKHLIKNINNLIDKGYSNSDISLILKHGNDKEVSDFSRKEKIKYLEEFYSIPYAKLSLYDRYLDFSRETGEDEYTTVLYVTLGMDKKPYTDPNIISKFSVDMLVNKYNKLTSDFVPDDLVSFSNDVSSNGDQASKILVDAFDKMYLDAKSQGLTLLINSAYRSYKDQEETCEYYKKLYGQNYVNRSVSLPGFSEHQTGLAIDIKSPNSNIFKNSKEFEWLKDNAHKYGFILRYEYGKTNITGFRYEPWHYRYVGVDIAKYIYENNITFEEYYVQFLLK